MTITSTRGSAASPPGRDGADWLSGQGAPGNIGKFRDRYLDELTSEVYAKSREGWSQVTNIGGKSPILAIENDGIRRVLKVTGWIGSGTKPQVNVYVGAGDTYVLSASSAVNIRGSQGERGLTLAHIWAFDASIADSDPGGGKLRLNHASPASATKLFVDNLDADGASASAWLDLLDDSSMDAARGVLSIYKRDDRAVYAEFLVTGAVVTDSGYREVPVSFIASAGTFTAADVLAVWFSRTGDRGADGWVPRLLSVTETAPPVSPADGDRYFVAATGTGAWAGHDNEVAIWDDPNAEWVFVDAVVGYAAYIVDEERMAVYIATATWSSAAVATAYGATGGIEILEIEVTGLVGAYVDTALSIPPSRLIGIATRVKTAITGATSFDVGYDGTPAAFMDDVAITDESTAVRHPSIEITTATTVRLTANGSNFTAGAVRLVCTFFRLTPPTS